jgi:hypothetical protein
MLCRGAPRADDEVVLVDSRLEWCAEIFAELPDNGATVTWQH